MTAGLKAINHFFYETNVFRKNDYHQHTPNEDNNGKKMFKPIMWGFALIRRNIISSAKTNKQAKMGSPWRTSFSSLNYFVVTSSFQTQGSWFFNIISIHKIKFGPNPLFLKTEIRKWWSNESKCFNIRCD